ncbi:MAG: ATP-binding protein [Chitinophagales bacterium]
MKHIKENLLESIISPSSLRVQLLSRMLLILAVLLILIGFCQYVFMKDVVYQNKAESMESQIMSMPYEALRYGFQKQRAFMPRPLFFVADTSLAFIDNTGSYRVISEGPGGIEPPRLDTQKYMDAVKNRPGLHYLIAEGGGKEQLVVLHPVRDRFNHKAGIVQVSTLTSPLKELLIRQLLAFLLLGLIAMLVGLLTFKPVLRKTLEPLSNMVSTAEQIDAGNLDKRFPTQQGQTEIDLLGESCNGMMERLETSFETERETKEQMRRFVADASHELRTPLTSIIGFLEVLSRGAVNQPEQLNMALNSMYSESQRLKKLVQDLLLLTKLDQTPNLELTKGFLDSLVQEMKPQLRILAGKRELSINVKPELSCSFDRDKMKQVILNLFQNAVQCTDPEKGHIEIIGDYNDNGVQLSVKDNGPGISQDQLALVFDRFYRCDTSRTRRYGGAGLGLSITQSIMEAHNGNIRVESQEGHGATFAIWLPRD